MSVYFTPCPGCQCLFCHVINKHKYDKYRKKSTVNCKNKFMSALLRLSCWLITCVVYMFMSCLNFCREITLCLCFLFHCRSVAFLSGLILYFFPCTSADDPSWSNKETFNFWAHQTPSASHRCQNECWSAPGRTQRWKVQKRTATKVSTGHFWGTDCYCCPCGH